VNIPHPAGNGRQQPDPKAYTITAAQYANAAGSTVNATTQQAGVLQITEADAPAMWAAVQARGGIAAYVEPPLAAPELVYRRQRERAYLTRLAKPEETEITYERTLGDILDILITQVEAVRATAGTARTTEFADLLTEIVAIKQEFPKPA
jgi:response regulator RpfG family c-di-GMP phosphodiesterase